VSADIERWPNLKLATHPVLDWHETEYRQQELLEMADALSKNPHAIKAAGGGVWDTAIETVLRALAGNPKALKELNRHKPTLTGPVLSLNRATHFHVQMALDPEQQVKAAWGTVATVWGVSDGQVKDDVSDYGVVDPGPENAVRSVPYRRDDAKRLMLEILINRCNASRRSREDVLKDFDADMRHRAAERKRKK
jgi:hypothetical protein